jgi:putative PEP-CTERM system TPR-repeat lipoprotein
MQLRPLTSALLIASLSTPILLGCDKLSKATPEELIERAKDFQAKGDNKSSIIELKRAIQKDPNNPQARWLLGEIYIKYGMGAEAEKELKKARELGVSSQSLIVPIARSLLLQREYRRLADEIVLTPDTPQANRAKLLQLQGEAQLGLGNFEPGCALFDDSARTDPQYVTAYIGQAKCAFARKDIDKARALIAHAKSLDPKDVQSWLLEAELADQLGDAKAAHAAYGQALKTEPDNLAAITGHAYTALKLNDTAGARKDIDKARKQFPNSIPVIYLEGLMALSEGKMEATRDKAQEILRLSPDHSSALLLLGLSSYKLGEYETARSNLSKVLVQQPGNTMVRKLLADIMIKAGEGKQAFDLMRPALNQPAPDTQTLALAASASAISGQLANARQLFTEALKKQPDQASLQVALARTQAASGEQEKALETLRLAAQNDTSDLQANKLLVQVLSQLRRYDEALAIARALQAKLPGKALPFNLEGTVYVAKQDLASARKSFGQAIAVEPADEAGVLNLAQIDMAENKLKDARARLEKLTSGPTKSPEALLFLATIDRREGNESAYVKSLQAALGAAPYSLDARVQLMRYYLEKNQAKTALTYTKEGDQYGLKSPAYLDLKGKIQIATGEPSAAVTSYQKLLQLAPNSAKAHIGMAMAQAASGNLAAVRKELTAALKLDPSNPEALTEMTMLEANSGNIAAARKHAGVLQSHYPKSPAGFALEGDILLGQENHGEAAKLYEKAFALAPSGTTALSLFRAQYRAGNKATAYEKMGLWLKDHPDDHRGRAYLASAYKSDARYKEAARHLEYILSKTPDNIVVQNDLALVYSSLRDPRALALAEKVYARQPKSAQIADTYGWVLLNSGQAEKGLGVLRKAADLAPKDPSIRYHLAQALAKTGNRVEARSEVQAALKASRAFPESQQAKQLLQELKP